MKTFIALTLLVVAVHGIDKEFVQQIQQKMKAQAEECAKEVSATPNDVAELFAKKIPTSREGKCIIFCMHKIYNAQNADGSLNMAGALENLEMIKDMDADLYTKVSTAFKKCESAPFDSDPCVYATNLAECIVKEGKALGLDDLVIE
ncbi:hypothetical protein Zmor_015352 [Zophobas morio]|uniref:Uncharacterized protein n=1 Tax=Zophobas morio TaxID=2755281 RepID=A0AA38IM94_9CUCU|nr:hypothetical protein Zmor_015352 [Zophobas morio]